MTNTLLTATVILSTHLTTNWITTHDLKPRSVATPYGDYQEHLERQQGLVFEETWAKFPEGSNYLLHADFKFVAGARVVTNGVFNKNQFTNGASATIIFTDPRFYVTNVVFP